MECFSPGLVPGVPAVDEMRADLNGVNYFSIHVSYSILPHLI